MSSTSMVVKPCDSSSSIVGLVQLVAGLGVDFAGLVVDGVGGQIPGQQGVGGQRQRRRRVAQLLGLTGADLGAGGGDDFTGVGVDQIELGLHALQRSALYGVTQPSPRFS
jgi:hypothetical protein